MKKTFLATGILLGFLLTLASTPAIAGGSAHVGVQYNSTTNYASGGNYGNPVVVRHYPNGRVEVRAIPVTHVYPNGESLIYQNGGDRVYSTGYGGAATCYVDCWHNGVNPNRRSSGWSFSGGVTYSNY